MEQKQEKIISAEKLREVVYNKQIELVFNKILDAAKNFKYEVYIRTDFKLNEKCVYFFKNLGYNVLINYDATIIPYKYSYEISWK